MLKKLTICILTLLMISVFGVAAYAEDLPELTLEELIQWKESTRPEYITEDMLDQVITGNLYEEYYGVTAAAAATPLRAFATCDRAMFQVGVKSTITVHPSGATAPYRYSIAPYQKEAGASGGYWNHGERYTTSTYSITPDSNYQYMIDFTVTAANGDYVSFYNKYETVTKASLSNTNTIGGKIKAVIASEIKSGMTDRQKALAIHEWLTHNAKYDLSRANHDPDGVLLKGKGVCESYARAYQMFMSELGIPNVYVGADCMNHAWNMIYVDGGWYHVDVTWDDPTNVDATVSGYECTTYFCVTDSVMAQDHTWDTSTTPPSGKGPMYPTAATVSSVDGIVGKNSLSIQAGATKFVRFTAPSAGVYLFETTGSKDTYGYLYNTSLDIITEDDNSGLNSNFLVYHKLAKDQVVYIGVAYNSTSVSGTESLKISRVTSVASGDNTVSVSAGRMSLYAFTAPSSGIYTFETTGSTDTYGYLFDASLKELKQAGIWGNFQITQKLSKSQVVYIGVEYADSSASGSTTLKISHLTSAAFGDNKVTISAGKTAMMSFTAPSDGTYAFETTGLYDTYGSLYQSDMNLIASDDDSGSGSNFRIVQQLTKNQVVIIGVRYYRSDDSGTENLSISLYDPDAAPSATLTTLTGRSFSTLSGKPTLLVFTQVGCGNCTKTVRLLSGYDLSALNVVIADISDNSLSTIRSYFANNASGITGATIAYNADSYVWSLVHFVEPGTYSIGTPTIFYIDANKRIVDYSMGYDSDLISKVKTNLGVTLTATSFSGSRLVLPSSTKTIGAEAFKGTAAKLIEIPASCTSIASTAFDGCKNLKIIVNRSNVAITPPAGVVVTDIPAS